MGVQNIIKNCSTHVIPNLIRDLMNLTKWWLEYFSDRCWNQRFTNTNNKI